MFALQPLEHSRPSEPRWSAWEQKEFLHVHRNWQAVDNFFAALVCGRASLSSLGLQEPDQFNLWPCGSQQPQSAQGVAGTGPVPQGAYADPTARSPAAAVATVTVATDVSAMDMGTATQTFSSVSGPGEGCGPMVRQLQDDSAAASPGAASAVSGDDATDNDAHVGDRGRSEGGQVGRTGPCSKSRARHTGGKQRHTYKVTVSYFGRAWAGWAFQPGRNTLQGALEAGLQQLVDEVAGGPSAVGRKAERVVVSSAGRTDAGVHAYGMPFSFYSWRSLQPEDISRIVEGLQPGHLRALHVEEMPRQFHATFSALWRRYVYVFPLRPPAAGAATGSVKICNTRPGPAATSITTSSTASSNPILPIATASEPPASVATAAAQAASAVGNVLGAADPGGVTQASTLADASTGGAPLSSCQSLPEPGPELAAGTQPGPGAVGGGAVRPPIPPEVYFLDPDPELLGRMLAALEGRTLDYLAYARDTPPGKDGVCVLHRCRCHIVNLPEPATDVPSSGAADSSTTSTVRLYLDEARQYAAGQGPCSEADSSAPPPPGDGAAPLPGAIPAASSHPQQPALCFELVGSRFLRRMVRVLVSTALREATPGAGRGGGREEALLECLAAGRSATAMPAPATGLCFAGAGYGNPFQ